MQLSATIDQFLSELGLNETERIIFIMCLQYGPVGISTLARLTVQPRSTLYGICSKLVEEGFLKEFKETKGIRYSATATEDIVTLLQYKKKTLEKQITTLEEQKSQFEALRNFGGIAPLVTYYTSNELITLMYDKIKKSKFVRSIWDMESAMNFYGVSFKEICTRGRVSAGETRRILYDCPAARQYKKKYATKTYLIKFLPSNEAKKADLMIMDGSVYHGAYGNQPIGIEISDPSFYAMQTLMFDRLRDYL